MNVNVVRIFRIGLQALRPGVKTMFWGQEANWFYSTCFRDKPIYLVVSREKN